MNVGNWIELAGIGVLVGGAILGAFLRDRKMFRDRVEAAHALAHTQNIKMAEIEHNYLTRFVEINANLELMGSRLSLEMSEHMNALRRDLMLEK
jgi:hypothetical protein